MNWKRTALAITCATTISLAACGNNDYGQGNNDVNNNTRPIGYNQTSDDPMNDRDINRGHGPNDQYQNQEGRDPGSFMNNQNPGYNGNNGTNNNNQNTNQESDNYEVAEKAQDRIKEELPEINRVYVLTTENNAYVAASWNKDGNDTSETGNEISDKVRKQITDIVKSVNKDIDNVYITTNPDFFDLADRYAQDLDAGEPVEGFFNRIGNMLNRVFPEQEEAS
ncbi:MULTISPECIES: YhcN/YlaJ family sporulation lipoprotein [Gracilibacillus]|uniref:YhcN/YlaJ family sporulation lipoprotein n=1 Tax=Gracilibacillus TaxID=74385 RepID=UPI0006D02F3D